MHNGDVQKMPWEAPPVDQPAPAADGAARNQHQPGYPPRQALAAAPRRPAAISTLLIHPNKVPTPPSLLTTRGAEAYALPPPPPPLPPSPSRSAIHHTEAPTLAPPTVPQPSRLTTRCAEAPEQASSHTSTPSQPTIYRSETNARIPAVIARVIEPRPTSTANTATAGEIRERIIRETMGRLRMDYDCQHTT
ncbi:hypothetical protein AZE42_11249 [Rhizopogon vesiculosus]|uniref:Uncharacterized protein n=1 Tax=Rhizopogon vesiculosus TaxID=180088 RepID=A0A1J8QEX5_9AGAM|nr:hypothetical protein AZE42_11249 [Rhizopogon vesiculosus]